MFYQSMSHWYSISKIINTFFSETVQFSLFPSSICKRLDIDTQGHIGKKLHTNAYPNLKLIKYNNTSGLPRTLKDGYYSNEVVSILLIFVRDS
jgi:hypothetical protein